VLQQVDFHVVFYNNNYSIEKESNSW